MFGKKEIRQITLISDFEFYEPVSWGMTVAKGVEYSNGYTKVVTCSNCHRMLYLAIKHGIPAAGLVIPCPHCRVNVGGA